MIKQNSGKIVNISSRGAFRGEPDHTAYGASKAGVNALSQSLAVALGKYNITVGVVAPGFVETDMTGYLKEGEQADKYKAGIPLGRFGSTEDIANATLFLASELSAYITGQVLSVDGGLYM